MQTMFDISIFIFSFVLSFLLVKGIIGICHKYSLYDYPGHHKRHKIPTPSFGGVAIFLAVWTAMGGIMLLKPDLFFGIKDFLPYILAASLIIFLTGLIDDLRSLSAIQKLGAQIAAGLILYYGGLSIEFLSVPGAGSVALGGASVLITVAWVVSLSNAINLIDGLDGLAAGVSIIASATMVAIGLLFKIEFVILISLSLMGAILGFWIFNRHPAKIFMGDCGALLIGYFFAVISLIVPIKSFTTAALFLPLVVLGVPLMETASSFVRRLAAGKNVMKADRRHIFHYLGHAGLSQKQIVDLFYLTGAIFGLISVTMFFFERKLVLALLLLFMVVIFLIYFIFIAKIMKKDKSPKR
jgi:UDP-GlcNAc:undecaprenyl-phosphate GlcNAc-1-phosphate transferase